jgi:tetratricopeptide (TPR) repeat protein
VDRIIRICKPALFCAALVVWAPVQAKTEAVVDQYTAARFAEINSRDDLAVKTYLELYKNAPTSDVLADRLFVTAIRSGDMATALKAARAQELRNAASGETSLLVFADAYMRKNWAMADTATTELAQRSSLGFVAPILRSWINVGEGKPHGLSDDNTDPLLAYYSNDQRVYLDIISKNFAKAKLGLRALASMPDEYVHDLMIQASPSIAANGDTVFAKAMLVTALGADRTAVPTDTRTPALIGAKDGLVALYVRLAKALLDQNLKDQALVLARSASWLSPENVGAKLVLARVLYVQKLDSEAERILLSIGPSSLHFPGAVSMRVEHALDAGNTKAAIDIASDGQASWPKSVQLASLLARAYEANGDFMGAISAYRSLAQRADQGGFSVRQRANYRLMLASALEKHHDWAGAKAEIDAALIIDPDNAQILNYLGFSLLEHKGDLRLAKTLIERANRLQPDSVAITDSLGWAYFKNGDFDGAVTLLEEAVKKSGNDSMINDHLGDAYWRSGRLRDARYAWRSALQNASAEAADRLTAKIDFGLPQSAPSS